MQRKKKCEEYRCCPPDQRLRKVRNKNQESSQSVREDSGLAKQDTGSIYAPAKRVRRGENGDAKAVALLP